MAKFKIISGSDMGKVGYSSGPSTNRNPAYPGQFARKVTLLSGLERWVLTSSLAQVR